MYIPTYFTRDMQDKFTDPGNMTVMYLKKWHQNSKNSKNSKNLTKIKKSDHASFVLRYVKLPSHNTRTTKNTRCI